MPEIIDLLKHSPRAMTTKEIVLHFSAHRSRRSIEKELQRLIEDGTIKRTNFTTSGYTIPTRTIESQRGQ